MYFKLIIIKIKIIHKNCAIMLAVSNTKTENTKIVIYDL
jgi:hypothetical protein